MKKDLSKLSEADKKKFLVYSKMNKIKIAMIIFLVLGVPAFAFGLFTKATAILIVGAVFLTLFVIFEVLRENANNVWKGILKEEREKAAKKEKKNKHESD